MADASEDLLLPTAMGKPAPHHGGSDDPRAARDDEAEDGDEVVDYRFLAALAASSAGQQGKIPSRGIKDFEPHGTQLQSATLDASRDAMHAVLREERAHRGDASVAVWDPEGGGSWVVHATGKWAVGVGRSRRVAVGDGDAEEGGGKQKSVARLYLLPEETLWLVERGTIDLRWPSGDGKVDGEGLPMSLQAAHAMLLGKQKPDGLTLEKFTVYQYLKRAGYNVERAEDNWDNVPSGGRWALLGQLLRVASKTMGSGPAVARGAGPLVTPGLYRDYKSIYRLVSIIPFHSPPDTPALINPYTKPSETTATITYHVYKPTAHYRKTDPGPPDFYVSVVDASTLALPTAVDLEALLRQTPYAPRDAGASVYANLRDGYRSVVLAVVDRGIVSFLRIADAAFGCHPLWARGPPRRQQGKRPAGKNSQPRTSK